MAQNGKTTAGTFNKMRLINALVHPSVQPVLLQWKGDLSKSDLDEKKQAGEDAIEKVIKLYNDAKECNEPVKDFVWVSAKEDVELFQTKLNFFLSKKVKTVQEMDAKMKELVREYNKYFQKWNATNNRSGHHDEPEEAFEDKYAKIP